MKSAVAREPMPNGLSRSPERVLRTYFHAKDENRPHLMSAVFSRSARLEMVVKAGTISFPPASRGVAEITDVLVRRFAQTYENVYSFYLCDPPPATPSFSCDWLVGMSDKANGAARVGCGRYDWSFEPAPACLADRLVITIEAMPVLAPAELPSVLAWLTALPYPWCAADSALASAPHLAALGPVLRYIARAGARA